jgi:hypothetical protein
MRGLLLTLTLALAPLAATANDSMAELRTGGLAYVRSDAVRMVREDLFISMDQIQVDYVFENTTDSDVESLVAFPMPPVVPSLYEATGVPIEDTNFLGFRVFVEGEELTPDLSQRALAVGIDVTDDLLDMRMSLLSFTEETRNELKNLPQDTFDDWLARGIITAETYDVGKGMETHPYPNWTLNEVYSWRMTFPAGQQIQVSHTYTPSVGGSAGIVFLDYEGKKSDLYGDYVEKYCIDAPFVNATLKRKHADGGFALTENWISYILVTAQNWYGSIGTFHLNVDKGSTDNLVSFCGTGIKKTGPTTFEVTYEDYWPERDLNLLVLTPINLN